MAHYVQKTTKMVILSLRKLSTQLTESNTIKHLPTLKLHQSLPQLPPLVQQQGHITYNTTSYGTDERLRVYSKLTNTDNEAFTVNGKVTDTLAVIVGLIAGAFTTWLTNGLIIAQQIAIGIVGGLGGSVAGGAIGITFSEDVAVNAYYYTLTGYNSNTNQYTQGFEGVARLVTTQSSSYYSQWFYDGYTPRNWKANAFAYTLWYQFFAADYYPGVLSYT